ncbi:glycosyltransferase family 39 protein [Patescibacteria group bacterium]|nr:glycosyltransferase family 39 protein [Patescibacteria group bacterium]MBU1123576.1 glycosyltransferase family 39 protein [Patescibacteria group bacterium]
MTKAKKILWQKLPINLWSWESLFTVVFLFAIAARLYAIAEHSFTHDEAWVALTIKEPNIKDMIFPDYWMQTTPTLLLFVMRFISGLLGYNEIVFRLLPLLAGIFSIYYLYLLAKKLTKSEPLAILCASFWGFGGYSLRYSQEFRPYIIEVFFAVCLLYFAECLMEASGKKEIKKYFVLVTIISLLAIGLSNNAILLLPVVCIRMLWRGWSDRTNKKTQFNLINIMTYCISMLVIFFAYYSLLISREIRPWMRDYWKNNMLSPSEWSQLPLFFTDRMHDLFGMLTYKLVFPEFWDNALGAIIILFVIGIIYFIKKKNYSALSVILLPITFAFAASLFDKYPFASRQSIYLLPFLIIGIVNGIEFFISPIRRFCKPLAGSILIILIGFLPYQTLAKQKFKYYHPVEDVKAVVEWFAPLRQEDDFVAVHFRAQFAFEFYDGFIREQENTEGFDYYSYIPTDRPPWKESLGEIIDNKLNNNRLWIIFALNQRNNREEILEFTEKRGCRVLDKTVEYRAAGYLFECDTN